MSARRACNAVCLVDSASRPECAAASSASGVWTVKRATVGFHRDEEGDRVADPGCGRGPAYSPPAPFRESAVEGGRRGTRSILPSRPWWFLALEPWSARRGMPMTRIAFIGVGNMGLPMVRNLLAAGHDVRAYDVSPDALAEAVQAGFQRGGEPCRCGDRGGSGDHDAARRQACARGLPGRRRQRRHPRPRLHGGAPRRLLDNRHRERPGGGGGGSGRGLRNDRRPRLGRRRRRRGRNTHLHGGRLRRRLRAGGADSRGDGTQRRSRRGGRDTDRPRRFATI